MNEMRPDRTALVLIEEAVQLLRTSPATVYALYCAGAVPFVLALFRFCAEMSYSRNAGDNCAASAVAVALTYCWMKGLQAFCCRELVRAYTGNVNRWWKPSTMLAIWSRQIALQPLGFFIKPLAWLLVFPVTYVSAFFQNLTVLGGADQNDVRKSWELARLWPKQSYAVYGLLSLLALIIFFDLYAVTLSIPLVLKILLGIESFLTRSYTWAFSPVLLIVIAAVAYFLIDLLAKAIEVIRCCDGESLATGADLLRRLAALQNKARPGRPDQTCKRSVPVLPLLSATISSTVRLQPLLTLGALLIATPLGATGSSIETSAPQSERLDQPLTKPALDRQIERVLQNPEYSWREPSAPTHRPGQKSIFEQWMASVRQMVLSLGSWISRLLKSLLKPFDLKAPVTQPAGAPFSSGLFNALGYLLWAAFAGTLILLVIRILKLKATKLPPSIVPSQDLELADEEIEADQLPDNEWYALAHEKMAAGEFRQAQRALFLAILSYLASHRLITVERWKSNTDYEKELGRKANHLSDLPALFSQSRLGFERCWYGADSVTPEDFDNYQRIYERIKHAGT
jgi:hypothetical protein